MRHLHKLNERLTRAFDRLISTNLPLALAIAYAAVWAVLLDIV